MARTTLYEYTSNATSATFDFRSGDQFTVRLDQLSDDIKLALMWHGLKQKTADAAAIPRDTDTGRAASDADKIGAMMAVLDRLITGQWNANREGGGATGGLLLRALVELYPAKTRESLVDYLAGKSDKEKAALRASPKIAPIIDRLKAEAGRAGGIDADDLLGELED